MTVKIGENPQGFPGLNKYIEVDGDGWRGTILALNKAKTRAVIAGDSRCMRPMLVEEKKGSEAWPVVKYVYIMKIPKGFDVVHNKWTKSWADSYPQYADILKGKQLKNNVVKV